MRPETEAELAEMIMAANGPIRIRGGGTRAIGNTDGTVLETGGLSGIELYEPGALTLVVKAGTPVAEVEAALASEGQRLAFEPMDHRGLLGTTGEPTMGGLVAANVSGPRRIAVGACRDFLLGVRFVDGNGTILKNGGRVMKNVTGYDLVKLMAGSWGTLGALTELSFKVLAIPETEATLVAHGKSASEAVALLSAALGTPFDVTGAAHFELDETTRTQVRVEGLEASVAYRAAELAKAPLAGFEIIQGPDSAALWSETRDVTPFADQTGTVWKVSVKPGNGPLFTAALTEAGINHQALYDWGGGLIWVMTQDAADIRPTLAAFGGHATLVRGANAAIPTFHPQPAPLARIEAELRRRFDPRGILNPGLMG